MRYAVLFVLSILALTIGAVLVFGRISSSTLAASRTTASRLTADTVPDREVNTPLVPTAADYARFAAEDRAWRAAHARMYSASELRARGNGHRTPREQMEDRVFKLNRAGNRAEAVAELERWVKGHPRDADALLSLARMLNEAGRTNESVIRYRQVLALRGRGE